MRAATATAATSTTAAAVPARDGDARRRRATRRRDVALSAMKADDATSRRATSAAAALTMAMAMATTTSALPARAHADRRTVVRREIKREDFESLRDFERARSGERASASAKDFERGIPVTLSSSSEGDDESAMMYTEPPRRATTGRKGSFDARRAASAAFQWSVIGGVVYSVRRAQRRSEDVSKNLARRFAYADAEPTALVGTRWRVYADIGRESGTWMPPAWGRSGMRLVCPIAIEFKDDGVVEPIATGAFTPTKFEAGTWSMDGDTLRFNLKMVGGLRRGDIEFGEESLYFKTLAWGDKVSANKGRMLVNQTRFLIRREWRSVGTFKTERIDADEDAGAQLVPPMRVRVPE